MSGRVRKFQITKIRDYVQPLDELLIRNIGSWPRFRIERRIPKRFDLNTLEQLQLPSRNYQIAFSVQTLHNLPALSQRKVIAWVYSVLSEKGFFFLLDRIAIPSEDLFPVYQSLWNRQGRLYSTEISEAASFAVYQQHLEANGDLPVTLEENLTALAESGFHVTALDVHGNRALMACIKKT